MLTNGDMIKCHRSLTHSQTLKDRATQFLRSGSGAIVTQYSIVNTYVRKIHDYTNWSSRCCFICYRMFHVHFRTTTDCFMWTSVHMQIHDLCLKRKSIMNIINQHLYNFQFCNSRASLTVKFFRYEEDKGLRAV